MANKKVAKVPFSRERFMQALDYRNSSIRKLGKVPEIERDEKTIRRCLHNGEIPPALLDRIGRYLDVHPDFLSGTYDRPIERIEDDTVRMMLKAQIRVEDHPYFTPAESEMVIPDGFDNLRYSKRSGDPLIILNKGPKGAGFMVCKDCGAAVPGDDETLLGRIRKPYRHPHRIYECHHPAGRIVNTYLGNQFLTDMVVYEFALDSDQINVEPGGLWIRRAGQTLAEAMTLAGGRLLDIEFNEIKSGYRLRYSPESHKTFIDIFLFDSLSSGAGYCSALAERTNELMEFTREVLENCPAGCDSACHECLMHYWNQRVHAMLDRSAALDLLNWCEDSVLPEALPYDEHSLQHTQTLVSNNELDPFQTSAAKPLEEVDPARLILLQRFESAGT